MASQNSYERYLQGFGKFTDVVTILLKKRHPVHHVGWRDDMAEPTAQWFFDRLNKKIFGRAYKAGYKKLRVVIAYEIGDLTGRPHFHFVVERPSNLNGAEFHQMIHDVFSRLDWGFESIDIRDYKNSGCLRYICKGNFERIILGVCSKG